MENITCQSQISVNFPALCVCRHYEGEFIEQLNRELTALIKHMELENREKKIKTATQGGYHTTTDFINLDIPVVTKLREQIYIPGIKQYMTRYYQQRFMNQDEIQPEQLAFKGWANIMRKGEWNAPHNHISPHNRISAVYYIKIPKRPRPEGALQFENPNQITVQHGEYGNVMFHPSEGDLILFPSYQVHFSHPFYSEEERILVACDIRVKDKFDEIQHNSFESLHIGSGS